MNYQQQAIDFANKHNLTLKVGRPTFKKHFMEDKEERYVFPCKLQRGDKVYKFKFGQSLNAGNKPPTMYDVLSCIEKYDVGTFQEFCNEFGYDDAPLSQYPQVMKIYKNVVKEGKAILELFDGELPEEIYDIS